MHIIWLPFTVLQFAVVVVVVVRVHVLYVVLLSVAVVLIAVYMLSTVRIRHWYSFHFISCVAFSGMMKELTESKPVSPQGFETNLALPRMLTRCSESFQDSMHCLCAHTSEEPSVSTRLNWYRGSRMTLKLCMTSSRSVVNKVTCVFKLQSPNPLKLMSMEYSLFHNVFIRMNLFGLSRVTCARYKS